MNGYMLQLNFALTIPADEYEKMVTPAAHAIASVNGLRWKVWLVNAAEGQAGGFYHFDSEAAADAYLNGPIVAALRAAPFARDVTVKRFDYVEGLTTITRGPVGANAAAGVSVSTDAAVMMHATLDHASQASAPA